MPKVIIVCTNNKAGFNCKNNYGHYKSAIFWLDIINKANFRLLVVISYTSLGLRSRNI